MFLDGFCQILNRLDACLGKWDAGRVELQEHKVEYFLHMNKSICVFTPTSCFTFVWKHTCIVYTLAQAGVICQTCCFFPLLPSAYQNSLTHLSYRLSDQFSNNLSLLLRQKEGRREQDRTRVKGHEPAFNPIQHHEHMIHVLSRRATRMASQLVFFFHPYQSVYIHFSHSNRTTGGLALNSNQTLSPDSPPYACMICCVFRCGLQW